MSNGFQDREEGFEAKLKHDEEVQFRIRARRDKLMGHWAAERMGMEGEAVEDYATSLVKHDMSEPGDADVIAKLTADFKSHGVDLDEESICQKLAEFEAVSVAQLHDEGYDKS